MPILEEFIQALDLPNPLIKNWKDKVKKGLGYFCTCIPAHMACRQVFSIVKITFEEVRKATGVPSLIFGCDTYDSREVPAEEIRGKISDFITEIVI